MSWNESLDNQSILTGDLFEIANKCILKLPQEKRDNGTGALPSLHCTHHRLRQSISATLGSTRHRQPPILVPHARQFNGAL
jgi:hypothetical protein